MLGRSVNSETESEFLADGIFGDPLSDVSSHAHAFSLKPRMCTGTLEELIRIFQNGTLECLTIWPVTAITCATFLPLSDCYPGELEAAGGLG